MSIYIVTPFLSRFMEGWGAKLFKMMCAPFVGRFNFLYDFVVVALSRRSSPWSAGFLRWWGRKARGAGGAAPLQAGGRPGERAHGFTKTEIALAKANPTDCPTSNQEINVTIAIVITAGTKIPETLSATFAMGAFEADASLTI